MVATERQSEPEPQPEQPAPEQPQPVPMPEEKVVIKNPLDVIMARFDEMDKRIEQLATVTVKIAEKVFDAKQAPTTVPTGNGGFGDIIKLVTQLIGPEQTDPMDALAMRVGHQVIDKTLDSTVKRVVGQLGGESSRHVLG